jgi:hypothetical protein
MDCGFIIANLYSTVAGFNKLVINSILSSDRAPERNFIYIIYLFEQLILEANDAKKKLHVRNTL